MFAELLDYSKVHAITEIFGLSTVILFYYIIFILHLYLLVRIETNVVEPLKIAKYSTFSQIKFSLILLNLNVWTKVKGGGGK